MEFFSNAHRQLPLLALHVHLFDWEIKQHGLPGTGLLFPQHTYAISVNGGEPGEYHVRCDPPLVVNAGGFERFKIRLTDTGYSWIGTIVIGLDYGRDRILWLPAMRILT